MSKYAFIKDKKLTWYPVELVDYEEGKEATVVKYTYPNEQAIWCDGGKGGSKPETLKIKLKDYHAGVLPLQNVDANGKLVVFPDMVELTYLHEAAILFNLKARHADGHPYTRTGDIIVAINPFQWFTEIYTPEVRTMYSNKLVWENKGDGTDPRKGVPPHVYETSCLCFQGLSFGARDQSILVSGESGAGKTETVKICMNHIASVQKGPVKEDASQELDPVVKRVLMSNPLLEAFGNASTLRNDNSSRFGKYTQLQFDTRGAADAAMRKDLSKSYCKIAGSKCDVYLLEKNRITGHGEGERTYHIFYQLIIGQKVAKEYWPLLEGTNLDSFKYVGQTNKLNIEKMTDDQHYDNVIATMKLIKVDGLALRDFMRAICAVMQCGNLTFGPKGGDPDQSETTSGDEMKKLSELIGVPVENCSLAFTERTMKTRNESYKVPLKPDVAKDSADAFAKEVYNKAFLWLVVQINKATCAEDNYLDGELKTFTFGVIGLLDIFGFESFKYNRFEQLCINYANEKLQQKFTEDIFMAVQAEYEREGIDLAEISYDDNSDVLELIESRTGLCAMLNEECVRPKGSPESFVSKVMAGNKKSPCLFENKQNSRLSFGVHHFAGKVIYTCDDFVSRNQDNLPVDLEECMMSSQNFVVAAKNKEEEAPTAKPKRSKSSLAGSTVWTKYKGQLAKLMGDLRKTDSKYIRCIKPNQAKVPINMEHTGTVEQLRCAGVIAAITLANSAFPSKLEHSDAHFKFKLMWDQKAFPSGAAASDSPEIKLKKECDALLTCALKEKEVDGHKVFAVGNTKCYFRAGQMEFLENKRAKFLNKFILTMQCAGRVYLAKKKVFNIRYADQLEKMEKEKKEREAREAAERERMAKEEAERLEREKKEAEERAEREAKEAAERAEREAAEAAARAEITKIENEMDAAEAEKNKKVNDFKMRVEDAKVEIESLEEATGPEARAALAEPKKQAAIHQSKIEMNTKEIEYLQKENKKIKKEHGKVKKKFDELANNNKKLMEQNEKAGGLFGSENDGAVSVHKKNEMLQEELEVVKKDHKQLKEDVQAKQKEYMNCAESRLEFQKTMARIINLIQDNCKDSQLVEDTVSKAFDAERESKIKMAALEAEFG